MKDRFVKIMLVIIAGLLLLNCIKPDNPSGVIRDLLPPVEASVPTFLEVGKAYSCNLLAQRNETFRVEAIDKESGWAKARIIAYDGTDEGWQWKNIHQYTSCIPQESTKQLSNSNK